MTATIDFAAIVRMEAAATKPSWQSDGRMVKDTSIREEHICQMIGGIRWAEPDANLIVALRNAAPALFAAVRVLAEIIHVVDRDLASCSDFTQSPEDAAIEMRARAALAAFCNVKELS